MESKYSKEALEVLKSLKRKKNVLISGSPGTGKSRLLAEVASAFKESLQTPVGKPLHVPNSPIPLPRAITTQGNDLVRFLPGEDRTDREVFRTVFHQNSKYKDFLTGIVPILDGKSTGFTVCEGTLYRASEHAKKQNGASLLIIDEINRGPAVQVFGGSIVGIEPEKRLNCDNNATLNTQFFEILDPKTNQIIEYALPEHLYILAAMNQADASIAPLDVAFLRRWAPYRLQPNFEALYKRYKLTIDLNDLPEYPTDVQHIYGAAIKACKVINERIKKGRSPEFQIGQGIFFSTPYSEVDEIKEAANEMIEVWQQIYSHVEEIYFGNVKGIAHILNITEDGDVLQLEEQFTISERSAWIEGLDSINEDNIYALFKQIMDED